MNIRCDRCGREPDEVAPMLKDAIWRQIARKNETLCKTCAHEVIRRRFGRELRFADLLPCAFNITWCSAFEELMPWDEPFPAGELERWQRAFATAERLIGNRKAMEEAPQQRPRCRRKWERFSSRPCAAPRIRRSVAGSLLRPRRKLFPRRQDSRCAKPPST
jgi:hypothetical protein